MSSVAGSVHLTAEQVQALNKLLADCRHNVNNCLSLIMSAMELAELKPDSTPKMLKTAMDQSKKVTAEITHYSTEFERLLHAARSQS